MNRFVVGVALLLAGCAKHDSPATAETAAAADHDQPPHGGTAVSLGGGIYHLELVCDADAGTLTAYVLDGEMENFVRIAMPAFDLRLAHPTASQPEVVTLTAVANPATGESVGNTSEFTAQGGWLRAQVPFDAQIVALTIHGTTFHEVARVVPTRPAPR